MMPDSADQLQDVLARFQIHGDLLHARPCKIGHINDTYIVTCNQGGSPIRYLLQKINRSVFRRPTSVMRNVVMVTDHVRQKLERSVVRDLSRRCLTVIPTRSGESFCRDENGEYWRAYVYIEQTRTLASVRTPGQAYQAGSAFGEFQTLLSDLQGSRLVETIPDFHNTRKRFAALQTAIQRDRFNRAKRARQEIAFASNHEVIVDVIRRAMANGEIPIRVTHNDAKFNNVLLDRRSGAAICVVDLDTVMPGCALYDFGDLVRSTVSPTSEDEQNLARIKVRMPVFGQLARGYLDRAQHSLTPAERALMAFAGKLITFETGLRFLTDYLSGDAYFRIHRPHQNLDRCRSQFRLVECIKAQEEAMQRITDSL